MPRLPIPGGDDGQWGSILNEFLSVELDNNGLLKRAAQFALQTDLDNKYELPTGGIPASDLAGNIPVTKLSIGSATSGQVLKYNGTSIVWGSNDATVTSIQGVDVSSATPNTGQVLKFNGTQWAPGTDQTTTGGSGITSLGDQTGGSQTFANDTNVHISSADDVHTLSWSGTLAVTRGGTGAGDAATARTNLGLGDSATKNVGTTADTVAVGNHTHTAASILPTQTDQAGKVLTTNGTIASWEAVATPDQSATVGAVLDGGGSPITTSQRITLPPLAFAGTISSTTILADVSGNATITVYKSTLTGAASTLWDGSPTDGSSGGVQIGTITLTASTINTDTTLTGWTTSLVAGDILTFAVTANNNSTRLTVSLNVDK